METQTSWRKLRSALSGPPLPVRENRLLKYGFGCFSVLLMLFTLAASTAVAQTSQATVRGSVVDKSNSVLVGATLKLTNIDTHVVSTTTTNEQGNYLFLNINPGTYTLEASNPGFSASKLQPFKLQVNQTSVLNFTLSVGTVSEVIEVQAVGEQLQAATAELGLTLEAKQIADLPLNTRNFTALFLTAPGVSPVSVGGTQTLNYTTSIGPAIVPSFNGQTQRSNIFILDGVLDLETFGNAYAVQPSLEAIQDMKMEAHVDSAEFGGSSGGTVNIATKGGTNQLHGSAWEYNQTPGYQALGYFTPHGSKRTSFKQNQFGATIGGPVVIPKLYNGHNKTFFFGQYEDYRRSGTSSWSGLVPTDAELAGDFTQGSDANFPIYDPASTTCDSAGNCTRTQFSYNGVKNVIPAGRISSGNIAYVKAIIPRPTAFALPGFNSYQTFGSRTDYYTYDWRVDENIGSKDAAFFRWTALKGNKNSPNRLNYSNVSSTNAYTYAGNYVHIFSPNKVLHVEAGRTYNQISLDYNYLGVSKSTVNQAVGFPAGLTSGYVTMGDAIPGFSIGNGYTSDFGSYTNPVTSANSWSVRSDYTYVLGRHTFKFGGSYDSIGEAQSIEWGQVGFGQNETSSLHDGSAGYAAVTGHPVASLVVNAVSGFTKRNVEEGLTPGGIMGYFAQDQIQLNPRLTVNLGIRYDLALIPKYGNPGKPNQYTGNFDFSNGTYVVLKTPGSCATLGAAPCIPTADGSLPAHVVSSPDGKILKNQYDNWEPRFGASFRLTPTTVLHGGIGLTFDNYAGLVQNLRGVSGNWPGVGQVARSNINIPATGNPFPGYSTQNLPAMTALPAATPFNQVNWFIAPNSKDAYSLQYNFGVQRQLDAATVVSLAYAGSTNKRLNIGGYYNIAATPGPGDPVNRRPYPYISPTFYSWSGGSGNYNAMQIQLSRRYSKGLASTVAYTWGKSIDEGCSGFFGSEGCSVQQIYNIPKAERSVSAFDVTHNIVASWNYALPMGRGKLLNVDNRVVDFLIGNWQWSGFAKFHSGTPYNVNINADIANIGNTGYERPNLVGKPSPSNRSYKNWLNYSSFAVPAQYTYGTIGRNPFRTQFYKTFDMSMYKEFPFKDRYRVKVTADAFNIFNQHAFGAPISNLSKGDPANGGTFGVINSTTTGARGVQMSAKFTF